MDQNPAVIILNPARCIALALPPTPMLQAPPHPDAYRPWVNLGQAVSQPPTQSLAPRHRASPLSGFNNSASQQHSFPFSAGLSAHRSKAAPSGGDQAPSHERQRRSQPLQTRFSSKPAEGASLGLTSTSPAALRFYLLAELAQTESSANWQCYLLMCSSTFRGVLQKVQSLARSLAHSLTRSLSHSLTRSLSHSLTHSLARSLAHSLALPPTHSVMQEASCSPSYAHL